MSRMGSGASTLSPYSENTSAPRFGAGSGLVGGVGVGRVSGSDGRPQIKRQESAPAGGVGVNGNDAGLSSSAASLARAAELVNGSHQLQASTISAAQQSSTSTTSGTGTSSNACGASGTGGRTNIGNLQSSRPAPPRPLLTANRPAPPAPGVSATSGLPKSPSLPVGGEHTPSSADLLARAKAHGPPTETRTAKPPGLTTETIPGRGDSLSTSGGGPPGVERIGAGGGIEKSPSGPRPNLGIGVGPTKSSPASGLPMTQAAMGGGGIAAAAASSTVGPPPVKPLQPMKKPLPGSVVEKGHSKNHHPQQHGQGKEGPIVKVTAAEGGVATAAAALEKPKEKEKRISTMNEVQIMEKLRSVVSPQDPKGLYSKIRKVGQG